MTATIADNAAEREHLQTLTGAIEDAFEKLFYTQRIDHIKSIISRERELVRAECVATLQKAHAEAERWEKRCRELEERALEEMLAAEP